MAKKGNMGLHPYEDDLCALICDMPTFNSSVDLMCYVFQFVKSHSRGRSSVEKANMMLSVMRSILYKQPDYPMATVSIFQYKEDFSFGDNPIKIRDIHGKVHALPCHSIFVMDDFVTDVTHGYAAIDMNEYFEMLFELNGYITFDYGMSFFANYIFTENIEHPENINNLWYLGKFLKQAYFSDETGKITEKD